MPTIATSTSPENSVPAAPCKLCGGATRLRFSRQLAHGLSGNFFECPACVFLQSDHLDDDRALQKVYASADADADSGAAWRQFCVAKRIRQLASWRVFSNTSSPMKALDLGTGSGFVPAYLSHHLQWRAIGYDAYSSAAFTPSLTRRTWDAVRNESPFQLVTATEVLEHFRNPVDELERIASVMDERRSFLYVTTGSYDPQRCDENWDYLAPHGAQHCAFFSRASMRRVAAIIGASMVVQLGRNAEWLFVRGRISRLQALRFRATAAAIRRSTRGRDRIG